MRFLKIDGNVKHSETKKIEGFHFGFYSRFFSSEHLINSVDLWAKWSRSILRTEQQGPMFSWQYLFIATICIYICDFLQSCCKQLSYLNENIY